MKIIDAILFFIASGRPTPEEQKLATALSQKTGKTVIFRNASAVNSSDEKPESCHGVAGKVPDAYKKLKYYSSDKAEKPAKSLELNRLGLPLDAPDSGKDLKKYFETNYITYDPRGKVDALVKTFRVQVLGEESDAE